MPIRPKRKGRALHGSWAEPQREHHRDAGHPSEPALGAQRTIGRSSSAVAMGRAISPSLCVDDDPMPVSVPVLPPRQQQGILVDFRIESKGATLQVCLTTALHKSAVRIQYTAVTATVVDALRHATGHRQSMRETVPTSASAATAIGATDRKAFEPVLSP